MKKSTAKGQLIKLIENAVDAKLAAPNVSPIAASVAGTKLKQKVNIFFSRLDKSSLASFMNFDTPVEKTQAIIAFAERIGVTGNQIPVLVTKFREISKTKDAAGAETPAI